VNVISRVVLSTSLAVSFASGSAPAQKPADPKLAEPRPIEIKNLLKADPKDDELRKLMKERVKDYGEHLRVLQARLGTVPGEDYINQISEFKSTSMRLAESLLELVDSPEEKIAALTVHLEIAKEFEKKIKTRSDAGAGPPHVATGARAYRLDAEIKLLKAKKELEKSMPK